MLAPRLAAEPGIGPICAGQMLNAGPRSRGQALSNASPGPEDLQAAPRSLQPVKASPHDRMGKTYLIQCWSMPQVEVPVRRRQLLTSDLLRDLGVRPSENQSPDRSPMASYRTKTELVYRELRRAILAGQYLPGQRIVADQVAAQIGVSRVPVRVAIVRLLGEGWLELTPHVGAMVPHLRPLDILETSVLRGALEGAAASYAVEFLTDADFQELHRLYDHMHLAAPRNAPTFPELNLKFHTVLMSQCPFPPLREQAQALAQKALYWRTVRFLPTYLRETQREHRAILKAAEARNAEAVRRLVCEHIETAGRLLCTFAIKSGELDQATEGIRSGEREFPSRDKSRPPRAGLARNLRQRKHSLQAPQRLRSQG